MFWEWHTVGKAVAAKSDLPAGPVYDQYSYASFGRCRLLMLTTSTALSNDIMHAAAAAKIKSPPSSVHRLCAFVVMGRDKFLIGCCHNRYQSLQLLRVSNIACRHKCPLLVGYLPDHHELFRTVWTLFSLIFFWQHFCPAILASSTRRWTILLQWVL